MEKQIITVLIKQKPYHLTLTIDDVGNETVYRITPDFESEKLSDYIPSDLSFDVNGTVKYDKRLRTVEGELIARTIWNAINDQFNKK
ncbi:MAG: hypothetical protein H7Y03_02785 [Chitinophagaceae bacterium]|nr:hypothetical protein [Chitinophagaceae bacterium]